MERYTVKQLGEMLANETLSLTEMYYKANKKTKVDKVYWLGIHLGFVAGLRACGMSSEEAVKVVEEAQKGLPS